MNEPNPYLRFIMATRGLSREEIELTASELLSKIDLATEEKLNFEEEYYSEYLSPDDDEDAIVEPDED